MKILIYFYEKFQKILKLHKCLLETAHCSCSFITQYKLSILNGI